MKLHKKLILVAATVLVVGGAGTGAVLAMQPDQQPPQAPVKQTASTQPVEQTVQAPVEQVATQPTQTQTTDPVVPQETIQQEAERRTREHALRFELDPDQQWMWVNKIISNNIGYDNEQKVRDFLDKRFQDRVQENGGYLVVYFDGTGNTKTKTVYL
jgi:hypothetical protein